MNEEQKRTKKIEKFARQLGFTSQKMMQLCRQNIIQVKGDGIYITIKKEEALEECIEDHTKNEAVATEEVDKSEGESPKECDCQNEAESSKGSCEKVNSEKQEEVKKNSDEVEEWPRWKRNLEEKVNG